MLLHSILRRHVPMSPSKAFDKRRITSFLRDVLRTRSLSPSNPIIDNLKAALASGETDVPRDSPNFDAMPRFRDVQPCHLEKAAKQLQADHKEALLGLESKTHALGDQSTMEALKELIAALNEMKTPIYSLQQTAALLWLMSDSKKKKQWRKAVDTVSDQLSPTQKESERVMDALENLLKPLESRTNGKQSRLQIDIIWAAKHLLRSYQLHTGTHLDVEEKLEFQDLIEPLEQVEIDIQSCSGQITQELIVQMYNLVGIQTTLAHLLNYENFAEQVLETRMATVDQVNRLQKEMAECLVPTLASKIPPKRENIGMEELLGQSGNKAASASVQPDQHRIDELKMIHLQDHVTLDGALAFSFRLSNDLLGVSVAEDDDVRAWHDSVRLFHVFDETDGSRFLGSFFLDPFKRPGKLDRALTTPIFVRGDRNAPTVCISLNIEPPAWDTDPTAMSWENVESLLHELGHVYQFLLAHSPYGTLLGPQNMPLDLSEFLPKFLEHWMMEKTTLYALIDASRSEKGLSDDAIDAAYRVRTRRKAMELAQQTFYGSLEMTLFSDFDLQGGESIIDLQHRMAQELIPHDVPDRKNITPLVEIMQENASGRPVGWYRYLWCDIISASVFDRFKNAYAEDASSMPKLRMQFRHLFLEHGAAIDIGNLVKEFELEEPNIDALVKRYDLKS